MHLTRDVRYTIKNTLYKNIPLKQIGRNINKHSSSISGEIKNHYITKNTTFIGRAFNNCLYRRTCPNREKNCNLKNCTELKELFVVILTYNGSEFYNPTEIKFNMSTG